MLERDERGRLRREEERGCALAKSARVDDARCIEKGVELARIEGGGKMGWEEVGGQNLKSKDSQRDKAKSREENTETKGKKRRRATGSVLDGDSSAREESFGDEVKGNNKNKKRLLMQRSGKAFGGAISAGQAPFSREHGPGSSVAGCAEADHRSSGMTALTDSGDIALATQAHFLQLIESGKAVRLSMNPTPREGPSALDRINKDLPTWASDYHGALDRLETDIVKAQRILRKDLAACQQERKQKEEAAEMARQNKEREEAAPPRNQIISTAKDQKQIGAPSESDSQTVKSESTAEVKKETADLQAKKTAPSSENTGLALSTAKPTDSSNQQPKTQVTAHTSKTPKPPATSTDPFPDPTPTSVGLKDFDFDSMFPDSLGTGNDINADANANDDFDFDMELVNNNADNNLTNDAGQTSMDSLLPGLESYANSLGDTAGAGDLTLADFVPAEVTNAQGDASQDGANAGGDSTFEDLFSYADFEMGRDAGQGDGNNGTLNTEFDDLFFNPDQD
ncbi:MAG: hypothetical protein Q9165_008430 [Trypethelium subeluteriae]